MSNVRIINADVMEGLAQLEDESVHCVVTSPPYWGLRDYGVDGQIGLEDTPEAFTQRLVEVFREVRRVLRNDGTLWLNLGDSYANTGKSGGGDQGKRWEDHGGRTDQCKGTFKYAPPGLKPKDLVGIPWRVAFALQAPQYLGRIADERLRYWMAGLVDGEGCLTILETKSPHGSGTSYPPILQVRMCDVEPVARCAQITGLGTESPEQEPPSQGGNRGSFQWRLSARNAADIARELYPYLLVKRRQAVVVWNQQKVRESYETKRGAPIPRDAVEKQQALRSIIRKMNAAEPVDVPSWLEDPPPLLSAGWYLRSDCIWHKPNPMPESVTDRPTKAHEYIFLMAKSERYYYDAQAIREPDKGADHPRKVLDKPEPSGGVMSPHAGIRKPTGRNGEGRNARSVWTITTHPYKEAHFATFPEALAERCIKAGCPEGGTVLDPFGGAGTTGLVAAKLGLDAVLIELNPEYARMAEDRITGALPLMATVHAESVSASKDSQ